MADIDITREDGDTKGRYVYRPAAGGEEAELTFSKVSATRIIVDHTGVPDSLRGQGIGQALSLRAVEDARANGVKIIPLCPFFKAQAQRHPEWGDVVEL
ncbi:GNAT family N-acetyltransferase [Qipengyuania flava]|uniref:GNAT family N-acetyltransferase n=1 Tax=Qipengyuania flava TaxID=192812 RepID=UPI001C635777|nr:GNAT family N-acetyltransferase [Qipengyuania flava]QYJ07342.1 N-acetyltransferase [Qipengyuania flava]